MIYEARAGESIDAAAASALMHNCDKFVHNGRLFEVDVEWRQLGIIREDIRRKETSED